MRNGYRSTGGETIPPAVENLAGCLLAQKVPNRPDGTGYVAMAPVGLKKPNDKPKNIAQGVHRLAVIAYGNDDEKAKLLSRDGYHASHRCHQPLCFNADHIVVEEQPQNEDRKTCKGRVDRLVSLGGEEWIVSDPRVCVHTPQCIAQKERAVARRA